MKECGRPAPEPQTKGWHTKYPPGSNQQDKARAAMSDLSAHTLA